MKKIIVSLLMLGVLLAGNVSTVSDLNYRTSEGNNFYQLEMNGMELTPTESADIYMYNIAGFDSLNFYVGAISSGNITTINLQPMLSNKVEIGSAQVMTSGTDITDFRSGHYKATIENTLAITVNVTMNMLLAR